MAESTPESTRSQALDSTALLRGLRRRWWIIALCALVAGAAAYLTASSKPDQYTATSSLLFRDDNLTQAVLGVYASNGNQDPERNASTNVQLLTLAPTVQRAAQVLGMSQEDLRGKIGVAPSANSDIVLVSATDADPKRAAYIANTYARVFITNQRNAKAQLIDNARKSVENQIAQSGKSYPRSQLDSLRQQANQLQVLARLQTGGVQLASTAETPTVRSAPRPKRNTMIALVAGLLLGVAVALLLDRLDNRVREADELSDPFDRPLIGLLPAISRRRDPLRERALQEALHLVRVSMSYVGLGTHLRAIAITSAAPDEGKSTFSAGLANVLAHSGSKVLLVEADMRRGNLANRLGVSAPYGLADVLARGVTPAEAVVAATRWSDGTGSGQLAFLPAGHRVPNPADLVESDAMRELLAWGREQFDVVIVDTPPALAVPETLTLLPYCDGALVIGRVGASRRNGVNALASRLKVLGIKPLGIVAFAAGRRSEQTGYDYDGAYANSTQLATPEWGNAGEAESSTAAATV